MTAKAQNPVDAVASTPYDESRKPDLEIPVVRWLDDEPQPSAMTTQDGRSKFTRRATVHNKMGQETTVVVTTSAKGWDSAGSSGFIRGYLGQGEHQGKIYWSPGLAPAHSAASEFI